MPRSKKVSASPVSHYFVDEAGDSTLFDKRGNVIIQTAGCSRFFMLGSLQVGDPDGLDRALSDLRERVTQDSYFRGIPSIQKTSLAFHAKDDIPEVRMEVFRILKERYRPWIICCGRCSGSTKDVRRGIFGTYGHYAT